MKTTRFFFFLFCVGFTATLWAQPSFKIGDKVEATYAGDWLRAEITGPYQENEFGSTYEVKFVGDKWSSRISSKYVRPLFRADATQTFSAGDRVEFRRWDNAVYHGEIIGVDGKRYEVRYNRDGYSTNEWVNEIAVRPFTQKVPPATDNLPHPKPQPATNTIAPGQKFKLGERVMYDDVGFLATKNFGTVVSYDAQKRMYTIRDEKDPSWKYSYACYEVLMPGEKPDNSFFIGTWQVAISGTFTTTEKEGIKESTLTGGMKLPPLQIKANGTYTWVVSKSKTIHGQWKPRDGVPGITLLKGLDGLDWTVYENTEAHATTTQTKDEIRFHHLPSSSGYYLANRVGGNKSCVLAGRKF